MKNILFSIIFFFSVCTFFAQESHHKFNHILITNDDGIKNIDRLVALARSLKPLTDRVSILVSQHNRSGSSNFESFGWDKRSYEVKTEYFNNKYNVGVYTIPDYPADCVFLGLSGLFQNDRPDLVISGINNSPNEGPSWFGSGTIGAVRTAAILGVPGIAFSGFNEDNEKSFSLIPKWIGKFLNSGIVEKMGKNSYLTVAFPEISLDEIKGIKIANRQIGYGHPKAIQFKKIFGDSLNTPEAKTIWVYSPILSPYAENAKDDMYYLKQGYIVITPMTVNENNEVLSKKLQSKELSIPKFNE